MSYQENEKLDNIGVVLANRGGTNGRAASQGTFSPSLGRNPAANKSMESLRILQWCQEFNLPRPTIDAGLEMYKEASRFLPDQDAQMDIPKFSVLHVHMRAIQIELGRLKARQNLTQEESTRRTALNAEWTRLRPEYNSILQRLSWKPSQWALFRAYRQTSQQRRARSEAAEFARLEMQTGSLVPTSVGAALQPTTNEREQQQLATPESLPWSPNQFTASRRNSRA